MYCFEHILELQINCEVFMESLRLCVILCYDNAIWELWKNHIFTGEEDISRCTN